MIKEFFSNLRKELVMHAIMARVSDLHDRRHMAEGGFEVIDFREIPLETIRVFGDIVDLFYHNKKIYFLSVYKPIQDSKKYSFYVENGVSSDIYDNINYFLNEMEWKENDMEYLLKCAGFNVTRSIKRKIEVLEIRAA
jgi:hypothetical protein